MFQAMLVLGVQTLESAGGWGCWVFPGGLSPRPPVRYPWTLGFLALILEWGWAKPFLQQVPGLPLASTMDTTESQIERKLP